jgi:hypothetical protein
VKEQGTGNRGGVKGKDVARMERLRGESAIGGLAGWLMAKLRPSPRVERRLALVEAEGRRILVATSAEGGPAFYPLDEGHRLNAGGRTGVHDARRGAAGRRQPRVSW